MNTLTKQTVYLPVSEFNSSERAICTIGIPDLYGDKVIEKEGYFFTPEQLNEYTANVIRQALETAAESKSLEMAYTEDGLDYKEMRLSKQSITDTFEETFKLYQV